MLFRSASFILKFIIQQMLLLMLLDNVAAEIQVLIPGHGRVNANVSITIIFLILLLNIMLCTVSESV